MTLLTAPTPSAPPPVEAQLHVLFFGRVADCFGRSTSVPIPAEGCPLAIVRQRLAARTEGGGEALNAPGVRAAIDQQMVLGDAAWVRPGQEVAFFSPFSGG